MCCILIRFKELQQLAQSAPAVEAIDTANMGIDFAKVDISQMRLSLAGVETKHTKALEKFGRYLKTESMVTPVFATPILTTSWLA